MTVTLRLDDEAAAALSDLLPEKELCSPVGTEAEGLAPATPPSTDAALPPPPPRAAGSLSPEKAPKRAR